jgi:SAM-dependent methyltransferase
VSRGAATERPKYVVEEENRALVSAIGRPRAVLDVGCGVGLNGAAAKRRGARVTGIEIVPSSVERARQVLDEVLPLDIESDESIARGLAGRSFDLMLFGDVLEHCIDPAAVLRRLGAHLEDEGHVVISLPNVAAWTVRLGLLAGRFDYEQSGILDDTHLRFFTLKTAVALAEAAGLEVLRTEQNPMMVRALKQLILSSLVETSGPADPTELRGTLSYKAYQALIRPVEDVFAVRLPGLLAFQNVSSRASATAQAELTADVTADEEGERRADDRRDPPVRPQILRADSSTKDKTPEIAERPARACPPDPRAAMVRR